MSWSTSELNEESLFYLINIPCLSLLCCHVYVMGWPLGSHVCCGSLYFSHFPYGVPGQCIDSWSLLPSLLWTIDFLRIRMSNPNFKFLPGNFESIGRSASKKVYCTMCVCFKKSHDESRNPDTSFYHHLTNINMEQRKTVQIHIRRHTTWRLTSLRWMLTEFSIKIWIKMWKYQAPFHIMYRAGNVHSALNGFVSTSSFA